MGDLVLFKKKQLVQRLHITIDRKDIDEALEKAEPRAKDFVYYPVILAPSS
jgi:hypothetical protein